MGDRLYAANLSSDRSLLPKLDRSPWSSGISVEAFRVLEIQRIGCNRRRRRVAEIAMRDRSKNRKPLQRGRNLSIEAIQTIQSLKRVAKQDDPLSLQRVFDSRFKRLLKLDMIAVLRELIRQNECFLAIKVFEDVRKEYWYKPQLLLYADLVSMLASNGLLEEVELLFMKLKLEPNLEPDIEGFNALLANLVNSNLSVSLAMECFQLMKERNYEPDRSSFRILVNGLELKGETALSDVVRQEARKCFGDSFEFVVEKQDVTA